MRQSLLNGLKYTACVSVGSERRAFCIRDSRKSLHRSRISVSHRTEVLLFSKELFPRIVYQAEYLPSRYFDGMEVPKRDKAIKSLLTDRRPSTILV